MKKSNNKKLNLLKPNIFILVLGLFAIYYGVNGFLESEIRLRIIEYTLVETPILFHIATIGAILFGLIFVYISFTGKEKD